jgi:hypothetical protein
MVSKTQMLVSFQLTILVMATRVKAITLVLPTKFTPILLISQDRLLPFLVTMMFGYLSTVSWL